VRIRCCSHFREMSFPDTLIPSLPVFFPAVLHCLLLHIGIWVPSTLSPLWKTASGWSPRPTTSPCASGNGISQWTSSILRTPPCTRCRPSPSTTMVRGHRTVVELRFVAASALLATPSLTARLYCRQVAGLPVHGQQDCDV